MNQQILEKRLSNLPLGGIKYFDTIDSTNTRAIEFIQKDVPDRFLIIANEQSNGRGRAGNTWFTPPDSALAFSLIIYPKKHFQLDNIIRITGLGSLAVCEGLRNTYHLQPQIKWPNDVLLDGKKVSGILAEGHWVGEKLLAVIVGIGINVASESVPDENKIDFPATSIHDSLGQPVDRLDVLAEILTRFFFWEEKITEPEFITTWQKYMAFIGQSIQIKHKNEILQKGKLIGIDDQGMLVLQHEDGEESIIFTGEIHLRPTIDR
ncbi:MAG: biotin--[acetyl-CoA-carboxylase] ligase [Anaerolineales bacterium]|jgi:BirA family biotin operon repressor/biotin-[acetyl-CoA-carboxylase] ligase